jgi:para-nitrobenzyl esterase
VQGLLVPIARQFLGVPYAAPPVGALRWQNPLPVASWGPATLNATVQPPGCIQHCGEPPHDCAATMSEDCLVLNVFTPRLSAMTGPAPVYVFQHGELPVSGAGMGEYRYCEA